MQLLHGSGDYSEQWARKGTIAKQAKVLGAQPRSPRRSCSSLLFTSLTALL